MRARDASRALVEHEHPAPRAKEEPLFGRLNRHVPSEQRAAIVLALRTGTLMVPGDDKMPLDEFEAWDDVVETWTEARFRAGRAAVIVFHDRAIGEARVRYHAWSDPRRSASSGTLARMNDLLRSLRNKGLLDDDVAVLREDADCGMRWETRPVPLGFALRVAQRAQCLDREICFESDRSVAAVLDA